MDMPFYMYVKLLKFLSAPMTEESARESSVVAPDLDAIGFGFLKKK